MKLSTIFSIITVILLLALILVGVTRNIIPFFHDNPTVTLITVIVLSILMLIAGAIAIFSFKI